MNIRCLIDTNIFIQLEEAGDDGWIKKSFADFSTLYHRHGIKVFVHPASSQDIERDPNTERKKKTLRAIQKYPELERAPTSDKETLEKLFSGINKSNDLVDCQLLYSLKQNSVDYLISEDDGVHKRARFAKLNERVFSVREFSNYIRRLFEPQSIHIPNIEDIPVYSMDKSASIFPSLRADYDGFDDWFDKCCREGRHAWTVKIGDEIAGVCIYKDEGDKCEFDGLGKKVLKLCTFKVGEDFRGSKLGELLLKTAFLYGSENGFTSTYLTTYARQDYLMEFLKDFGFQIHSKKRNGEFVFYKTLGTPPSGEPRIDALDFHIKYAPNFYFDEPIKKYVIPIVPKYHNVLFPEISRSPPLPMASAVDTVPGNTIKKVYLSNSKISSLASGSLVLFYRSEDQQEITTVGIVEKTTRTSDLAEAVRAVGKRSVYSMKEIAEMTKRSVLITEFRLVRHLKNPISFKALKSAGVLKGAPQSIMELPHDRFDSIAEKIRAD